MKPFLEQVAEDLHNRFDTELGEVAIVFNNKRPIEFLKKHLGALYERPVWSPIFYTIQSFFSLSTDKAIADFYTSFFILLDSYNSILLKEGQPPVSELDFLSLGEILLRDFNQIDYELVDPEKIFYYLKDLGQIERQFDYLSEDQRTFLNNFWSSIPGENRSSFQEQFLALWKRLPELYQKFQARMDGAGLTTVAHAYRNLAEQPYNSTFIQSFKKIVFIGFNALTQSEGRVFQRLQQEGKALFYFDGDTLYMDQEHQEAGLFLRRNIQKWGLENALGSFPSSFSRNDRIAHVYATQGKVVQAKTVHKLLTSGEINPNDTAVILADESLLMPLLQSIPEHEVNISMGFPIKDSQLYSFVLNWLDTQDFWGDSRQDDETRAALQKALRDNLYRHSYNINILANLGIDSDRSDSMDQPASGSVLYTDFEKSYFKVSGGGIELLENLINCLEITADLLLSHPGFSEIEKSLNQRLTEVLRCLLESIRTVEWKSVSIQIMTSFIRKVLPGISAPMEGSPFQGIQVMGMLESRCLDFKNVIVLGANEGQLPGLSLSPTLIPDSIRRSFGLPILENQDALSAYLYYRLWHRSEWITTVYNANVGEGSGECTRFVKQIDFESSVSMQYHYQNQRISASSLPRPLTIEKTPEVMAILKSYLGQDNTRFFSASALNLYLECPLQFFFKYIAGIIAPEEQFDVLHPITIGRVVHGVMEYLYTGFQESGDSISQEHISNLLRSDLLKICSDFLEREPQSRSGASKSASLIASHIIEEHVRQILTHDKDLAPFIILELENKSDYKIRFPFQSQGKTQFANLYTIIDRVDTVKGQKRIVDYKTGNDSLLFKQAVLGISGESAPPKAVFQSLFYTLIFENVAGEENVEPHLYILRSMGKDGTFIIPKGKVETNNKRERLNDLKNVFKERLAALLAEIYDPNIPFRHNEASTVCLLRDYAQFCHPKGKQNLSFDENL